MLWIKENIEDIADSLETDFILGLTEDEAAARLQKYGRNQLEPKRKEPLLDKLDKILVHISEIPALILMGLAIIAGFTAIFRQTDTIGRGFPTAIIILILAVIYVAQGIWQEHKAEESLEALKKMSAPQTTVLRDRTRQVINSYEVVPGDMVEIEEGDIITADARIIEATNLQIDESVITGNSQPVAKDPMAEIPEDAPLGDRHNMVYSGCTVTNGRAIVIVVETGMNTEVGRIALLLNTRKLKTPLQLRLQQLAKRVSLIALIASVVMFAFAWLVHDINPITGEPRQLADALALVVALGVAAVAEYLPVIIMVVLCFGVFNMNKRNAVIRRRSSMETVGNTSVICADKTGTLTENKMNIRCLWHMVYDPTTIKNGLNEDQRYFVELLASCSNASIDISADGGEYIIGDPTEIAIIRLLHDLGLTRVDAEREYPRVHELPFDSTRRRMTTMHRIDGGYLVVTKGAFEHIPVNWEQEQYDNAADVHDDFAENAMRVIAVSFKMYAEKPTDLSADELERDQEFLGLIGMTDPPRPESAAAVKKAKQAGIRTVMITGDHLETAMAVARDVGIYKEGDDTITGAELTIMSDRELRGYVKNVSVYARVSPEDKLRIVQALAYHGEVVTMVGDGVNDAPALKAADVGIAMGISADVSKMAADMVISDNNLATVVDAIAVGRASYDNMRKTIAFLLSANFAQIFILLAGMLVIGITTLSALQILLINVILIGIPGTFMTFEKPEPGTMKRKALPKSSGIWAGGLGANIAVGWACLSVLTMGAFWIGAYTLPGPRHLAAPSGANYAIGVTMAFVVLSLASNQYFQCAQ